MDEDKLNKALVLLELSSDDLGLLTEREVEDAAGSKIEKINRRRLSIRDSHEEADTQREKLNGQEIKVTKARTYVLKCLHELSAAANAGHVRDAMQKRPLDRNDPPRSSVPRKAATVSPLTAEIVVLGLSHHEAEYARKFYREGVTPLRNPDFHTRFSRGDFYRIDASLVDKLDLPDRGEDRIVARLNQIRWPFPESADTQREFRGAKLVIEFIRALVGEPQTNIEPLRRLLIEGSCLYADDSACGCRTQVNIQDLQSYVEKHADQRFEYWDILQIVLCYFLAIRRPESNSSDTSRWVMLQFISEVKEEIEKKVGALSQDVRHCRLYSKDKLTVQAKLSDADLLNELSGEFTIADLESNPKSVPAESIPFIKRQFDVLSGPPNVTHFLTKRQACGQGTGASETETSRRSCLERNLIHHRIASWLDPGCRPLTWSAILPKEATSSDKSNIVGTLRTDFLPLGDYVSLAQGFPTTGWRKMDRKSTEKRRPLARRFTAHRHTDDLIAGLLGGAFAPRLCRANVACCPECRHPLLDMRCSGKPKAHFDGASSVPPTDTHCHKAGLEATEFCMADRLIMPDTVSGCFLYAVPAENPQATTPGHFRIADESSGRRKFYTVWFCTSSPEISARYINLHSADGVEHQLQREFFRELPKILDKLDQSTDSLTTQPDYAWGRAFRQLHGLPLPKCTADLPRSLGWLRADLADYSSWPPRMQTPEQLRTGLRRSFWSAVRDVFSEMPFVQTILALNPNVKDRIITLRYLGLYPKNHKWSKKYTQIMEPFKLLKRLAIDTSGEVAAHDAVVKSVASSLRDWFVPAFRSPWLALCRLEQEASVPSLPWKDRVEISGWWAALSWNERNKRLDFVSRVSHSDDFQSAVNSDVLWTEPEDFTSLPDDLQQQLNRVAQQLWTLAFYEKRQQLWDQMDSWPATSHPSTLQKNTIQESLS